MPVDLTSVPVLLNIGFAISALGFLVRDILWLRLLSISGYLIFCSIAVSRGDGQFWNYLFWYVIFIAINVYRAAWLIYERQLQRLNEDELRLRDLAFRALDPVAVKRLLRAGTWLCLPAGEFLTHEGKAAKDLFLIAEGEVEVRVSGHPMTSLHEGQFVGEIAFLRAGPATATATVVDGGAAPRVRCVAWQQDRLRRQIDRDIDVRTVLYAAIGTDLSGKIAADNVRVSRTDGPESAD